MKKVVVTNITNKDQTVINIPENKAVTISPGAGFVIDTYTSGHAYLYKSYQRKGLKVDYVDESFFNKTVELKSIPETKKDLDKIVKEQEEKVLTEVIADSTEDKKFKRSRKSTKSSDNSEEVSAITESGE